MHREVRICARMLGKLIRQADTCSLTHTHTHTHTSTQAHTHTRTYTFAHAHTQARIDTQAHTLRKTQGSMAPSMGQRGRST